MITAIRVDEGSNLQNNTGTNDSEPPGFVICYESRVLFLVLHPHWPKSPAKEEALLYIRLLCVKEDPPHHHHYHKLSLGLADLATARISLIDKKKTKQEKKASYITFRILQLFFSSCTILKYLISIYCLEVAFLSVLSSQDTNGWKIVSNLPEAIPATKNALWVLCVILLSVKNKIGKLEVLVRVNSAPCRSVGEVHQKLFTLRCFYRNLLCFLPTEDWLFRYLPNC